MAEEEQKNTDPRAEARAHEKAQAEERRLAQQRRDATAGLGGAPTGNVNARGRRDALVRHPRNPGFWHDEKERFAFLASDGEEYARTGWRMTHDFEATYRGVRIVHSTPGVRDAHTVIWGGSGSERKAFFDVKEAFAFATTKADEVASERTDEDDHGGISRHAGVLRHALSGGIR